MGKYIRNILNIKCDNEELMKKIKNVIMDTETNSEESISMTRFMPEPEKAKYNLEWNLAVWGTDMIDPKILVNDKENLKFTYQTDYIPNANYCTSLCYYIQELFESITEEKPEIIVEHHFYDILADGPGGFLRWKPDDEIDYQEIEIMEYLYYFNRPFHDWIVEEGIMENFSPELKAFNELFKDSKWTFTYADEVAAE
jgi:hypothetical protein